MSAPILITADEINCLIFAYLQDSGFNHSAFSLRTEGRLEQSPHYSKNIPRGELVELLSKALLYVEVEAHWKGDSMTTNCKSGFSLLETHVCSLDTKVQAPKPPIRSTVIREKEPESAPQTNGDAGSKRKADAPSTDNGHADKRAKRSPEDMDVDPPPAIAESSKPKPKPQPQTTNASKKASDSHAVRLLRSHKCEVFVAAWNPAVTSQIATGSKDGIVHVWELGTSLPTINPDPIKISYFTREEAADLTSLDWNFDGTLLAIGSYDSILRICTPSGKLYFSHRQHEGPIFATKFSQSGQWLATASLDGTACVWDVKNKKLHQVYNSHKDCCLDLDWLDDDTFASCGADMMIHIMRINDQKPIKTLVGHSNEINQIKCNPSKTRLASCADDQTARIWNISDLPSSSSPGGRSPSAIPGLSDNSDKPVVLEGHEHSVSSIAWCPRTVDGVELIATASFDTTARLWNSATGECVKIFSDHFRPVYALSFSPDGKWMGTGSGDGWLQLYNVKTKAKAWGWFAGPEKPGVFEIAWQQSGNVNRIGLALERHQVGLIDVAQIPALQDAP